MSQRVFQQVVGSWRQWFEIWSDRPTIDEEKNQIDCESISLTKFIVVEMKHELNGVGSSILKPR